MAVHSVIKTTALAHGFRLDAEYYKPRYLADAKQLSKLPCVQIKAMAFITDGIHSGPEVADTGGIPYLGARAVRDNGLVMGDALRITERQHVANLRTSLKVDDVLITTTGTIGWTAVAQAEDLPANIDRDLGLIRVNADAPVDPYFLATFLNCEFGRFQTAREATGNVQQHLFIDKLRELNIPVLDCAKNVSADTRRAYKKRREAMASVAAAETMLVSALGLDHLDLSPSRSYSRTFKELLAGCRFGAEYYMPCKKLALDAIAKMPHEPILHHALNIRDMWDPTDAKRGSMVRNFDLGDALEPFFDDTKEPVSASEVGSTKKRFQAGDLVISRLRSYLKEIAVVRTGSSLPCVGSSEFIVLRPTGKGLSSETILVYLRCPIIQTILKWSQDGSNHPRFDEDDLIVLPVPDLLMKVSAKIERHVHDATIARQEAAKLLSDAKATIEKAILQH